MSTRRRIKTEDKIRIAKACTKGTIGLNTAAEQPGVHPSVVYDWVRLYQTEGIESLFPRKENRRYDPALKEAAVKDYLSGRGSLRGLCKIYKIRSTYIFSPSARLNNLFLNGTDDAILLLALGFLH